MKRMPALTKKLSRPDDLREILLRHLAPALHRVEHRLGGGERIRHLLHRCRPRLLQVVGADIHRVPLGEFAIGEGDDVGGELEARRRREDVGAAREIFLDDVVLRRAGEIVARRALRLGGGDIERQQPGRGGVDGHRGVHARQRNAVEEGAHVAEMRDRHADLADLARGQRVVAVIAGLGRQIESDREAGLAALQIGAVERVRGGGRGMAGICPDQPGLVAPGGAGAHPCPSSPCCAAQCAAGLSLQSNLPDRMNAARVPPSARKRNIVTKFLVNPEIRQKIALCIAAELTTRLHQRLR